MNLDDEIRDALAMMADRVTPEAQSPAPVARARRAARRSTAVGAVLAVVALIGGIAGVRAIAGGSPQRSISPIISPSPSDSRTRVSATSSDGTLQCTLSLPAADVDAGAKLEPTVTLTNNGKSAIDSTRYTGTVRIEDSRGALLWDSGTALATIGLHGPPPRPLSLAPNQSLRLHADPRGFDGPGIAVTWGPKLFLRAACLDIHLPPLIVHVQPIGASQSPEVVLTRVMKKLAPGMICTALHQDTWSPALFKPPAGSHLKPMRGTCAAQVEGFGGFSLVRLASFTRGAPNPTIPKYNAQEVTWGPGRTAYVAAVWWIAVRGNIIEVQHVSGVSDLVGLKGTAPTVSFVNGSWKIGTPMACGGLTYPVIQWLSACKK